MKMDMVLALALSAAPLAAPAADLSYTYVEAGVSRTDMELNSEFEDAVLIGGFMRGSLAIGESFYLLSGYESGTDSNWIGAPATEVSQLQLGGGLRRRLSDGVDFLTEASYITRDISFRDFFGSASDSASGYRVSSGLRGEFFTRLEALAKANYTDVGDDSGEFSATLGAQFKFSKTWRLLGELVLGGDISKYELGVRASF